jgi:class 3 adenylate cyclase/tetratricopeptide (TPR) repeat protein
MAERLEVETSYRIVSDCLSGIGRAVTDEGGYVVKTLGDGLMSLFGAPIAHGDDPERAARAALRIQAWMREYGADLQERYGLTLRLRVGVNYGSVVAAAIPAGGRPEYDVLGDAVNVAQRIESAAEPGSVCVSEPFYRITRALFAYRDRGLAQVKGKTEPLQLYELLAEREDGPHSSSETALPVVGRERELELLREAARALGGGSGSLLALTGEAGMGKSRLLEELSGELAALGVRHLRSAAGDAARDTPLALWRTWLLELLPIEPGMEHAQAAAAIREALPDPEQDPWADWLAALAVDPQRLLALEAGARETITRGALGVFVEYWQGGRPAALLVDEAGLLDSLSLQLLVEMAEAPSPSGQRPALLVALAGRVGPGYPPPEAQLVSLLPLSSEAAAALIGEALPEVELPEEVRARVIERAGGSPLFLDLILRAAREAADPAQVLSSVPDTVYGLVQAQVDSLADGERRVARVAAVLGRAFAERWLGALCEREDGQSPWHPLEGRELLVEQRPPPLRELAFRHGALQEVLYESLLKDQRRREHARAAAVLALEAEESPDLAARVASHWRRAEEWKEALAWTLRAAVHAASLYSGQAARDLYGQSLELAEQLGERETAARSAAGLAGVTAHQGEYPAALELYALAEAHLDAIERETPEPELSVLGASIKRAHARVLAGTGALSAAMPLLARAEEVLERAPGKEARREYVRCLTEQAHAFLELGSLEDAERAARRALEGATEEGWDSEAASAGAALGRIYPLLGNWAAAERELRRAADLAEACGDWQSAAACWINLGSGLQQVGRLAEAAEAHHHALEHAERIGDVEKTAIARMDLGVVCLNQGAWDEAQEAFGAAVERFRAMGHPLGVAASLYNLSDSLRWAGRVEEARAVLHQAEESVEQIDAPALQVHLSVARAELSLCGHDPAAAAERARQALVMAAHAAYQAGGSLARLTLGRALSALGDLPGAETALQAAIEGFDRSGERLEAARARAELAAVLERTGRAAEAERVFQAAVTEIREFGAAPWLEHLPRVGRVGGPSHPPGQAPAEQGEGAASAVLTSGGPPPHSG